MSTAKSVGNSVLSESFREVKSYSGKGYFFLLFCLHISDECSTFRDLVVAYHDDIRRPHAIRLTQVSL